MGLELDIEEREALRELEHEQLVKEIGAGWSKVASAISSLPKEDPELKKLMAENRDAINNFVKAVAELKNQEKQEVKVETNQDKVVEAVTKFSGQIADIMKGIDGRLTALEKRPEPKEPKKLKVTKRGGWGGTGLIEEVTIEYNK